MDEIIKELSEIDIDILNERAFYEKIFKCLKKAVSYNPNEEDLKKIKLVLKSIGCEKLQDTDGYLPDTTEANIFAAKLFVSEFLDDDKDYLTEIELLLNKDKRKSLVLEWLEHSREIQKSKTRIPYYKLSKKRLLANGYDEEKSEEFIQEMSDQIISEQTGNDPTYMIVASQIIAEKLETTNYEAIKALCFTRNSNYASAMRELFQYTSSDVEDIVIDAMFGVHDAYKDLNRSQILNDNKLYMFMPAELIGWNNAKKYLEYVKPILETTGKIIDEQELEDKYNTKVRKFFLNNHLRTTEDLYKYINNLPCYLPDIESVVIPTIEQSGIGKVEDVRNEIISYLIQNPTHDITLLSYEEMTKVYENLKLKSDSTDKDTQEYKFIQRAIRGIEREIKRNPNIDSSEVIKTQPAKNIAIAVKNVSAQDREDANNFMAQITKELKPGVTHSDE